MATSPPPLSSVHDFTVELLQGNPMKRGENCAVLANLWNMQRLPSPVVSWSEGGSAAGARGTSQCASRSGSLATPPVRVRITSSNGATLPPGVALLDAERQADDVVEPPPEHVVVHLPPAKQRAVTCPGRPRLPR